MISYKIKYYKIIVLLIYAIGIHNGSFAAEEPDYIYVHFDKEFYTSGETIHYKIYFLNKNQIESELVHLEIVDIHDSIKISNVLPISNNSANGSFNLPVSFDEGNYFFKAYTLWNLNFNDEIIFTKVIPIFNEWDEDLSSYQIINDGESTHIPSGNFQGLSLRILNQNEINAGDSVHLQIEISSGQRANLSISVTDLNLLDPDPIEINKYAAQTKNLYTAEIDNIKFKPEKTFKIKGKVFDATSNEPISSRVLSVYNVREASFDRLISENGNFSFEIPVFSGSTDLQIINMNPFEEKVPQVIRQSWRTQSSENIQIQKLPERTPSIKKYLFYSKLRRKLDEIFEDDKQTELELTTTSVLPFIPDKSYDMNKYRLLKNLEDFVKEGVVYATSYKENGKSKLKLFNIETKKYFMTKPWLMVDDHFIFDDSIVYNIPFNHLKRVDIFTSNKTIFKYFEPIMIQGGVIAIYTKNNFLIDYIRSSPNTLTITGFPPETSNSNRKSSDEVPDFNPVIYWNPEIITESNEKFILSFPTNNVTGNCLIRINGIDGLGKPMAGELVYRVFP